MADLNNECLSDTQMCEQCIDSVEDAHHFFFNVQNIKILEMYFAKQYKLFLIETISLILIYYSMVVLIMDLILILKYLKQYIHIEATKRFI